MMNTSKSQDLKLQAGTIISGKWHGHTYRIVQSLGYGATGYVYLAEGSRGLVAIKMSSDSMAITSEVNVLKHFSKVQGCLGPSLLDVDDWVRPGYSKATPFYVMEYLKGTELLKFIESNGSEWLSVLLLQLLADLERLHQEGWVFGDLKPDNLLVVGPPARIRWLDVGGTTIQGRSIKEYTEFFDRGYWGLGSRKAEPSYDLFAVAMIILNTAYPRRFSKKGQTENHLPQLLTALQSKPALKKYEKIIIGALQGKYKSALAMRTDLIASISKQPKATGNGHYEPSSQQSRPTQQRTSNAKKSRVKKQPQKGSTWRGILETAIIAIFLILAYVLYIAGQMM